MLKLLQRQKVLVKVESLLFHDEALKQLKAEVAALKAGGGRQRRGSTSPPSRSGSG